MNCCFDETIKNKNLVNLRQILSKSKRGENTFRIPDYQRGYAWGCYEDFSLKTDDKFVGSFVDLWKDILRLYYLGDKAKSHYIGMLSLDQIDSAVDLDKENLQNTNAFYVVDGQQRLTSLIIIIKTLQNYIKKECNESPDESLLKFNYILNRFDYSVNRHDTAGDFFKKRIIDGIEVEPQNQYEININNAKEYIDIEMLKFTGLEAKEILNNVVLEKLIFNVYFIKEFDVRATFEIMNNRGKPLTNLEILKNRLMYLSTFVKDLSLSKNLKEKIDKTWKTIYENLCKGSPALDDDEFLKVHWWVYKNASNTKGKSKAYINEILNDSFCIDKGTYHDLIIDEKDFDAFKYICDYIDSLEYLSEYWLLINNPSTQTNLKINGENRKLLYNLSLLPLSEYVRASLMAIQSDKSLSDSQKQTIYKELERCIFIRKCIGFSNSNMSPLLTKCSELYRCKETEKQQCFENIMSLFNEEPFAISKDIIKQSFEVFGRVINKEDGTRYYSWKNGLIYFLYKYNFSLKLQDTRNEQNVDDIGDTIEHILPQTPKSKYWSIVLQQLNGDQEKQKKFTNSLGNMLLLSRSENTQVSNCSYPTKRNINIGSNKFAYIYGTRSAQEVATNFKYWTLHTIYERERMLFEKMFEMWIFDTGVMKLNEFMSICDRASLFLEEPKKLAKSELDALDDPKFADERSNVPTANRGNNKDWFKSLKRYFNPQKYSIRPLDKNVSYKKSNEFTVKEKGNKFVFGGLDGDHKTSFEYSFDTNVLYITRAGEILKSGAVLTEKEAYFVETFERYLKNEKGLTKEIQIGEDQSECDKDFRISEDEFKEKYSYRSDTYTLFEKLKAELISKYQNANYYFTNLYCAFNERKNFVDFKIEKKALCIDLKPISTKTALGGLLDKKSYTWPLRFQIKIRNESEISEALELIEESYQYLKK